MSNQIRKISVGSDYPDGVLHYQVGKKIKLLNEFYQITDIIEDYNLDSKKAFDIFIANNNGKVKWKTVTGVPTVIEYNISFS